jgi:hypothetical protein
MKRLDVFLGLLFIGLCVKLLSEEAPVDALREICMVDDFHKDSEFVRSQFMKNSYQLQIMFLSMLVSLFFACKSCTKEEKMRLCGRVIVVIIVSFFIIRLQMHCDRLKQIKDTDQRKYIRSASAFSDEALNYSRIHCDDEREDATNQWKLECMQNATHDYHRVVKDPNITQCHITNGAECHLYFRRKTRESQSEWEKKCSATHGIRQMFSGIPTVTFIWLLAYLFASSDDSNIEHSAGSPSAGGGSHSARGGSHSARGKSPSARPASQYAIPPP